ncbi:hypothetical protein A9P44_20170 [Paenibacillus polymyxa]|nr:hypothetical protein A9P44_20170 [Paenibacillus polymyxa]
MDKRAQDNLLRAFYMTHIWLVSNNKHSKHSMPKRTSETARVYVFFLSFFCKMIYKCFLFKIEKLNSEL